MEEFSSSAPAHINMYAAKSNSVWGTWRAFPAQEVLCGWGKKTDLQVGLYLQMIKILTDGIATWQMKWRKMDGRKQEISLKMKNEWWISDSGFLLETLRIFVCTQYCIYTHFNIFFLLRGHEHKGTICHSAWTWYGIRLYMYVEVNSVKNTTMNIWLNYGVY